MEPGIEDKVAYLIAVISEFAAKHTLTTPQAYRYLERFKGLDFVIGFMMWNIRSLLRM